jgi:8-oxo-dGTP pyrophosphatase MutT (NUDIX family)
MIESAYLASRYPSPIIASEIGFVARLDARLPIRMDTDEHDGYGWFPFADAYEKIRWTDDREALERVEQMIGARV